MQCRPVVGGVGAAACNKVTGILMSGDCTNVMSVLNNNMHAAVLVGTSYVCGTCRARDVGVECKTSEVRVNECVM